MKNLKKTSLLALGLMMSLTTLANNPEVMVKESEKSITKLHFDKVRQGSTLIIKDVNGLVLYKEAIEQTGAYSKGFDLTTLPDGDYFFELNSELKIEVIPFNVKFNEVEFNKDQKEFIYKPVVRTKGELVYVWKTDIDQSAVSYKIYYAGTNELVHTAKFDSKEKISKTYDFSGAKKGNYVFVFESEGRSYTKTIRI